MAESPEMERKLPPLPEEYKDTEIQFKFECLKEKDPEACHYLAKFENHIRRNHKKAAEMYKANCDEYKYAESCCEYGSLCGQGLFKVIKVDAPEAKEYLERGCEYGSGRACYNLGVLTTTKKLGPEPDIPKAVSYFQLSCDKNHGSGCRELGAVYLNGEGSVKKDFEKAKGYLEQACNDLGDWKACRMLSSIYKKGTELPANEELSEKYMKQAEYCKIHTKEPWKRIF